MGTNVSFIGIANSVDLISKVSEGGTKERELVARKLVFSPYNEKQILKIISQKIIDCWTKRLDGIDEKWEDFFSGIIDNNS